MPGRDRLKEMVKESARDLIAEADQIVRASDHPGQVTESFVDEHARHAHEAVDKAAEAAKILVREGE